METWGLGGQVVHDFTLYSGNLGTALLLYKSYQITSNEKDLFSVWRLLRLVILLLGLQGRVSLSW